MAPVTISVDPAIPRSYEDRRVAGKLLPRTERPDNQFL